MTELPRVKTTKFATESALETFLAEGIESNLFTGAAAAIGTSEGIQRLATTGMCRGQSDKPVTSRTLFDAASTTKPIVTTTVVLRLIEEGLLTLSAPLEAYIPSLSDTDRGAIPIRHLLTHTSGLQPYYYQDDWDSPAAARQGIYDTNLLEADPGERFAYSCLNFVHLADIVRQATGHTLAELAHKFVFDPAKMKNARIGPLDGDSPVASTREREYADRVLTGEIHDPIGRKFGGESGNAGLFATATDLGRFAKSLLMDRNLLKEDERIPYLLAPETIQRMRENWTPELERPHGLGWRLAQNCTPAPNWSRTSFGHTGFTGTSIWIDPEAGRFAVLLSNEVYCGKNVGMDQFRERFHGIVAGQRW